MDEPDLDIPAYASTRLRARNVDSGTRKIALIAAALAVIIISLAMVWSGVHTGFGPPPVVKPPPGPMRTLPANPGGLQVPGANEQIMSGVASSAPATLAPLPPPPDFAKLQSEMSQQQAPLKPAPAAPMPHQAVSPSLPLPPPAPTSPPASPAMPSASQPPPVPAAPQISPAEHGLGVQLAALNSEQAANQEWQTLVARMPNLLVGRQPVIQRATVNGHAFWRLRLAGFADTQAAKQFCDTVRSEGAACEIAHF